MDYLDKSKVPVKTRKAFTHLYNHSGNFGPRGVHKKMKGQLLNNAIDLFFQTKSKGLVKNLEDAIIYIIRAEPKTNYLYVADGGKKFDTLTEPLLIVILPLLSGVILIFVVVLNSNGLAVNLYSYS